MSDSLWNLAPGKSCRLIGFANDLAERYKVRLMELGFNPGERVSCLIAPPFGAPRVYQVSNTVFSLEDTLASQLMTEADK